MVEQVPGGEPGARGVVEHGRAPAVGQPGFDHDTAREPRCDRQPGGGRALRRVGRAQRTATDPLVEGAAANSLTGVQLYILMGGAALVAAAVLATVLVRRRG
jgi:hypothetical protein